MFRWVARGRPGQEGIPGKPVLQGLPHPSRVVMEVRRGESRWEELPLGQSWSRDALPVLGVTADGVHLGSAPKDKEGRLLILHRRSQLLRAALHRELVMTRTADDPEVLFRSVLTHVAALLPGLDVAAALADLKERHSDRPGLVEKGLGLAHLHSAAAPEPTLAVIRLPEGLDFDVPGEPPIRVLFLLVSPLEDPDAHLGILADIAHVIAAERRREALLAAEDDDELYAFLVGETSDSGAL